MPGKVFVDANCVLELLLQRVGRNVVLKELSKYEVSCITPVTVGIVLYFAEREKLDLTLVEQLTEHFEIIPLTNQSYLQAKKFYAGQDFEDALQVASCLEANIKTMITLDKGLAKKYAHHLKTILLTSPVHKKSA